MTLNLLAPMLLTHRLWPTLSAVSGAVVNVGSSGGEGDEPYGSPEYGAAKAGVRRFTASLGSEPEVRVMAVVPGWIGLDRAQRDWAALSPDQQRDIGPLVPPQDVARTVLALLDHGRAGEIVEMLPG
jgi:NAD(P)-dependent dehydrogenase (short-subunit alcohol dehydrogenase family)